MYVLTLQTLLDQVLRHVKVRELSGFHGIWENLETERSEIPDIYSLKKKCEQDKEERFIYLAFEHLLFDILGSSFEDDMKLEKGV